jgi:hypothetical protein
LIELHGVEPINQHLDLVINLLQGKFAKEIVDGVDELLPFLFVDVFGIVVSLVMEVVDVFLDNLAKIACCILLGDDLQLC